MPVRPLLSHVNEVNARALDLIDVARREHGLRVDSDLALATAILHDVDKPMIYRYYGNFFSDAALLMGVDTIHASNRPAPKG